MARIRTVKPEFATDEKVLDLTDSCALFFVLLWNHCDDEGKIENTPKSISKKVCRWTPEKVQGFIRSLSASGQLRVSLCSGWLQVTGWSHQRINRPFLPKIKESDLQWNAKINSVNGNVHISDHSLQVKDRIVKDRKVSIDDEALELISELKTRKSWHETVAMKHKIGVGLIIDWLENFRIHIISQQKIPADHEAPAHFDNWLRIQLSQPHKKIDPRKPIAPVKGKSFGSL